MASHWAEAGELELAIPLWIEAGKAAVVRHAFQEAADNFRVGLRLLLRLPEAPERDTKELEIGFALRRVLYTLSGYRGDEVKAILTRNAEISEKSGDIRLLVEMTFSSFVQSFMASNWLDAAESADELAALSEKTAKDPSAVTQRLGSRLASYSNFLCLYYRGMIKDAERHFTLWNELPEVGEGLERNRIAPCFSHAAACAALAGRLDLAMERQAMAVAHSVESGDLWDQAFVSQFGGLMHILLRDPGQTMLAAEQALKNARASGFQQLEALTLSCAGWAKTQSGYPEEGLALIRDGHSKLGALNNRVSMGVFILFRAEAEAACGYLEAAQASFDEALDYNPEEQLYIPLILIGRARFERQTGNDEQAIQSFQAAIALSSNSGAKTFELRARIGLAEVLGSHGNGTKALEALKQCVRKFGEQPLSIDLQDAKALIQKQTAN